jgi:molecular chaperone GrpE
MRNGENQDTVVNGAEVDGAGTNGAVEESSTAAPEAEAAEQNEAAELTEVEVLRRELEQAQAEAADFKNRFLRARADLENYRRRAAQELLRAREAGLDSAVLPLLSVYDDLGRALSVGAGGDPAQLIPGIQAVRDGLKRNLGTLGLEEIGDKGEPFNPDLHEALTAVPTQDESAANTIAEVVQTGFVKEERLVRPARVVVFQG